MANGLELDAAQPQDPGKARTRRRHADDISFADRVFLAIENPVLRRELLTALRSNKAFILQGFFLAALGLVVYVAWPTELISTSADRARMLFHTFGQGELVLLSVMAPAFSASAMTIEKEKRCIDLLLTSPINPDTILMGKYLSSVVYLLLLIISTAPLVTVIIWLPGLGPAEVAGLYLLLVSVACCFGMIGLTCSTFFHRSQASLAITYMIVLPLALILLAFAVGYDGFFLLESAAWPSAMLLIATVIMYRACHARLRRPFDPVFKSAEEEDVATQTGLVLVRDRFPDNLLAPARDDALLPDGVNPVYQKEIRSEIFGRGTLFLRLIIQISMFLSVVFLTFLYLGKEHIFVYYLIIFTMLVAPAFACNTFTQERERGTLDLLLTTLVRPSQIVTGKFLSCMRLSLFLTGLVGVTMGFYLFVGQEPEAYMRAFYLGIYLLLLVSTIVFETSLAMFFSMIFKSTFQSMITSYTVLLLLFAVPVAAHELITVYTKLDTQDVFWVLFTSPFEAIYSVSPKGTGVGNARVPGTTLWPAYEALYLGLSVLLMGYVYATFERRSTESSKIT
ncbi:MAG TPA: ABC transporter permease subunit [Planctomycetota bacterium]|jgi:ABC-type transport system involved in multi-copper enzyme maturation permease subunit